MTPIRKLPQAYVPPPSTDGRQPPWLLSYADFISCLLACFVLLFSMVSLDQDKFLRILGNVPGRQEIGDETPQPVERAMTPDITAPARDTDYLLALLQESFAKDPVLASLTLTSEGGDVRIALPTAILLEQLRGGAAAKPGGLIYALAGTLRSFPNEIVVEGKGAAIGDGERWGNLLALTQMAALALVQGGISDAVPARTDLAGEGGIRVDVVVTDRGAAH